MINVSAKSTNESLKRNRNDPRMNATIAIDETMRLMTMIYGQSRDLQLTNKSPPHTGDDCAYFSIQRRCFDVSGTASLKNSGRIIDLRIPIASAAFRNREDYENYAANFQRDRPQNDPIAGILLTDYQYGEKKGNEVGFVVIRNFIPSSEQLISSMTALIALNYIISFLSVKLFVQPARLWRGVSP